MSQQVDPTTREHRGVDVTRLELHLERPAVDEVGTLTIGSYGGWAVQCHRMLFNWRLILGLPGAQVYDFGWCYASIEALVAAVQVWQPQTEAEPLGFLKRATARRREPGEHARVHAL
jgi:hypothetical protein